MDKVDGVSSAIVVTIMLGSFHPAATPISSTPQQSLPMNPYVQFPP